MIRFFRTPDIHFMGGRRYAYLASGLVVAGSLALMLIAGIRFGIDFAGGTILQLHTDTETTTEQLRTACAEAGIPNAEIQEFGEKGEFTVKYKEGYDPSDITAKLSEALGTELRLDRNETVGPRIGRELQSQAAIALSVGILLMLAYIWLRFNIFFGLASVVALFHDVVITIGVFTLAGHEVSIPIIAALLTIIGYSINDSIVISDRIREQLKRLGVKPPVGKLYGLFNSSVNSTLSRTINTSLTTLLVLGALMLFGGPVIFDFAFVLFVGVLVGTYSSVFVVAALVLDWERLLAGRRKQRA